MIKKIIFSIIIGCFYLSNFFISNATEVPTTIDSRIKTIIYNENEVFELTFFYGFQSFIEFSDDEEIELISLGESYPWRITPVGKRLFIRPMQIDINTNMMIITTKRTYQFQIKSASFEEGADEELIYSVRFFYPDTTRRESIKSNVNLKDNKSLFDLDKNGNLNFDYVMTGNIQDLAPIKVFDNGINTFFEFNNNNSAVPTIYAVDLNGNEVVLDYKIQDKYIVINSVHLQFSLREGIKLLCIFNNKIIK